MISIFESDTAGQYYIHDNISSTYLCQDLVWRTWSNVKNTTDYLYTDRYKAKEILDLYKGSSKMTTEEMLINVCKAYINDCMPIDCSNKIHPLVQEWWNKYRKYEDEQTALKKANALAKLTREEKQLLGLLYE